MFDNRRIYRNTHQKKGLVPFEVTVKETNLNIQADKDLTDLARKAVLTCRQYIEAHIDHYPEFASSLAPLTQGGIFPDIINKMRDAGKKTGVGPMAAIAGAVAEYVGEQLLRVSDQVVVENGGDIFIKSDDQMIFTVYAGDSPLSMKTGIQVAARQSPYAMCTSSGTIGHSKSFGRADAVSVLADSAPLADAAATALCNKVQNPADINDVIENGKSIPGIQGLVIISGNSLGLWGNLELVKL